MNYTKFSIWNLPVLIDSYLVNFIFYGETDFDGSQPFAQIARFKKYLFL